MVWLLMHAEMANAITAAPPILLRFVVNLLVFIYFSLMLIVRLLEHHKFHRELHREEFIPTWTNRLLSSAIVRKFPFMKNLDFEKLKDRSVVAAITHDEARIWLLNDDSQSPVLRIERTEPEHMHVRQAQAHHGHASEIGEVDFFDDIADSLSSVSAVVLLGHGAGKANAAERFEHHAKEHHKSLSLKIAVTGHINIPAMGDAELITEARRRWKTTVEFS